MALPNNYPLYQDTLCTTTNSIASTPLACAVRAPYRGTIVRIGAVSHGAFTTDCSIAVAIITSPTAGVAPGAGTAVGGSPMILDDTNSAAGTQTSMVPTSANVVNEGDIVVFTPSGSTGTTIGGTFTVTFRAG
jgi:hypothetical protein